MPSYATLQGCRKQLATGSTVDDDKLADYIQEASQAVDDYTGLWFDERRETHTFTVLAGGKFLDTNGKPLISITTLTNGDGTTIDEDNIHLYSLSQSGRKVEIFGNDVYWKQEEGRPVFLSPDGHTPVYSWSDFQALGYEPEDRPRVQQAWIYKKVSILGLWGYHTNYDRAWKRVSQKVGSNQDDSQTTLVLNTAAGTTIDVGSILRIGTEYQLVTAPVASTSAATTLTVERAYNGSTAAAHTSNTDIYVWQPERSIQLATEMMVAALYAGRNNATGDRQVVEGIGAISIPTDIAGKIKTQLANYINPFSKNKLKSNR